MDAARSSGRPRRQRRIRARRAALHLTHVETFDDRIRGRVAHAWLLPSVGVAAIATDGSQTSPEQIARSAGWPELRFGGRTVDVPFSEIRDARATVDVQPDEDAQPSYDADNPPLVIVAAVSLLEYLVHPCCRPCHDR